MLSYLMSQAEFSIWRSLKSQCIKLSCSNCCLLQFIFVLSLHWQNVKSFSFHCLQLSASARFWYAVPALLREKSSKDHDEARKPDNCRHRLTSLFKLGFGFVHHCFFSGTTNMHCFMDICSFVIYLQFFWDTSNYKESMYDSICRSIDSLSLETV